MTDHEIIEGLIARDGRVTEVFFFVKCRPLFFNVMKQVFGYEVDYDEMVNELYVYLMDEDAVKLKNFKYRCSVYQWMKILAIRFFIKKRGRMTDAISQEPCHEGYDQNAEEDLTAKGDIKRLFGNMPTKRYVHVIQCLILEDWDPDKLANEMNITTANLYNIKRRAIAQLTRVALHDIKEYDK